MPVAGRRRHLFGGRLLLVAAVPGVDAFSSAECWVGGWTPEICCSAPGAKGNPLCWDSVFTYDRCCTETEEGIQFDLRRRNFVADMVRRGATVQFDIRQVFGGRTGAVASRTLPSRSTVLRVPFTQVFSLKSVHSAVVEASRRESQLSFGGLDQALASHLCKCAVVLRQAVDTGAEDFLFLHSPELV